MSFFPSSFNPRDPVVAAFTLVEIDAASGVARFLPGIDGRFTDTDGNVWYGSQLLEISKLEVSINGTAPSGRASISYFQDPAAPDLIADIKANGDDEVRGREIRFFVQPFTSLEQMYAPVLAPIRLATRTMTTLEYEATGDQTRRLSVSFEGPFENRRTRRALYYNSEDHSRLVGYANPSLDYMPTENFEEEKLFG